MPTERSIVLFQKKELCLLYSSCLFGSDLSIALSLTVLQILTDFRQTGTCGDQLAQWAVGCPAADASEPPCSSPTGIPHQIKKSADAKHQRIFGGVPSGTRTHGLQIHNLAR